MLKNKSTGQTVLSGRRGFCHLTLPPGLLPIMIAFNEMIPVRSSALRAVGYDGSRLTIVFQSGKARDYHGVPPTVFYGLLDAQSKGRYFNRHIRGNYRP